MLDPDPESMNPDTKFLVIKPWIRIGIQPNMLDPDPESINSDPKPCFYNCCSPILVELSLLHGLRNLLISRIQQLAAGPHLLLLRSAVAAAILTAAAAPLEAA
jgi:hypothetical protein